MPHTAVLPAFACLLLVGTSIRAQSIDFYVDGRNGQDLPGRGVSPQTAWKTLAYSFTQIQSPVLPTYHTLHVAGNQVYAPSTNGETFPIVPGINISIVGDPAARPVLVPPTDGTAIALDPSLFYERNQSRIAHLVFQSGAIGIAMRVNANPLVARHRPKVDYCDFRDQSVAGIDLATFRPPGVAGTPTTDPRFFNCRFSRSPRGVWGRAAGNSVILQPDIEDCSFEDHEIAGIVIQDTSQGGSNAGGLVRYNQFYRCGTGIELLTGISASTTRIQFIGCYVVDALNSGIHVQVQRPSDPYVLVDGCSFVGGQYGLRVDGVFGASNYTFTVTNCFARGQYAAGYSYAIVGATSQVMIDSSRNLAQEAFTGFQFGTNSPQLAISSRGDRALACLHHGFLVVDGSSSPINRATVTVENAILAANGGDGLFMQLANLQAIVRFVTAADQGGAGLRGVFAPAAVTINHCVFANNQDGEVRVPVGTAIDHSVFQGQAFVGRGNLRVDPQLVRPLYRLAAGSPCIDAGDAMATVPGEDYEGDARAVAGHRQGPVVPDIGADEFVPDGSAHPFGVAGTGRPVFHPVIGSQGTTARLGQPLVVTLSGALDSDRRAFDFDRSIADVALLMAGFGESPITLPFDLSLGGSFLWTEPALWLVPAVVPDPAGAASFSFGIPNQPEFVAATVVFQWLVFKQGINPLGVALTQGLRVTCGMP